MLTRAGAALVLVGLLAFPRGAAAEASDPADEPVDAPPPGPLPNVRWFTLETPHFDLHYYPNERAFAERAAHIAERAYRLITRYLNWQPSGRVSITLNDQVDSANGFASSVPYNYIYAYGVPPGSLDELSDFDDYVKLLITHEFTHVVHLDTILSWCPRTVNAIFGKIYAPNLSQPTWFIEGLAVLMESRQTTAGRLRSSFFDMYLRVPFLENRIFGSDAVSAIPLAFPQGTTVYLYGSSVLRYIEDRYGPGAIREISHRYADECIPGGINRIAARTVGRGYVEPFGDGLWQEWQRSMAHRFALEADEAERRGLTAGRRLTHDAPGPGGEGPSPRFFPDGTLVFLRQNTNQSPAYVRIDLRTGARQTISDMQGAGPAAPTPSGHALVFERRSFVPLTWRISGSAYVDWRDLFRLDVENGTVRPLTRAWRAHEPDVSPDGTQIACIVASKGPRQLALVPIEGGTPRVLTPDAPGFAYTPAFSPDGRLIAYSRWKPGGFRDIHIYDLAAGRERTLAVDRAMDVDPRFTPDGRYLLYASDRTGIYNVYAYELATERLYQVTNVLSGAFQPVVSPDGKTLVYSGFDSDGFDLYTMPFEPARFLPAQPFANFRLDASPNPDDERDAPDAAPGDAIGFPTETHLYEPWRYMYPRKWNLQFYSVGPLGPGANVYIDSTLTDPVGNHTLVPALLLSGDLDPSVSVYYAYNRLWPSFALSARRSAQTANDLVFGGTNVNYRQHTLGASASVGLPVLQTADASANVSLGYDYTAYGPADPLPVADPTGPATIPPERGPDADVYAQWVFSNAHSWQYSISNQEGRSVALFLKIADPALGGRFHTTEVNWSWTEYATPPWARLHAFAFQLAGGVGIGDKRQLFGLGGLPEQDVLRAVFLNQREQGLFLRGYPVNAFVGDSFQMLSSEYRAPLVWIEHGYETFPLYFRRIWGTLFTDVGDAYFGEFNPHELKVGAGAELHVQFNVFYFVESDVKIGYAHGFQAMGMDQIYLAAAASF